MTEVWAIAAAIFGSLLASVGSLFLKFAVDSVKSIFKLIFSKYFYIGVIVYGISTVFGLWAFSGGDLSIIYPIFALNYVWISFLSIRYLGEQMNSWKWSGIGLIILGVVFISFG